MRGFCFTSGTKSHYLLGFTDYNSTLAATGRKLESCIGSNSNCKMTELFGGWIVKRVIGNNISLQLHMQYLQEIHRADCCFGTSHSFEFSQIYFQDERM